MTIAEKSPQTDQDALIQKGEALPLMEYFPTLQGEGYHSGCAAYFIRLGGCDVGCSWCDVKESWDADAHKVVEVDRMVEQVVASGVENVVITGGEPAMYELGPLTRSLKQKGLRTWIETSGVHPLTGIWDWICFSPKKFKTPLEVIYQRADELKVVVFTKHDLQWAEEHARKTGKECLLYLQPEWGKREKMMPLIIEKIKADTKWRISLQTHKYMNIP